MMYKYILLFQEDNEECLIWKESSKGVGFNVTILYLLRQSQFLAVYLSACNGSLNP